MGAIASIGGAILGARGADKAADAPSRAAKLDLNFQRETRDLVRSDLQPWRAGGQDAQAALDFELGLRDRPTFGGTTPTVESFMDTSRGAGGGWNSGILGMAMGQMGAPSRGSRGGVERFRVNGQTFGTREEAEAFAKANAQGGMEYGGYQKTPGFDFRMNNGMDNLEASAAARGGLMSGAALKGLEQFRQDYSSNEYGNYLARLSGRADTGMSAAAGQGQAAQTAAAGVSDALSGIGNAGAAGAIGASNAWQGGLQNLATWNYMKNSTPTNGAAGAPAGGGNWWGF